jgi:hypothetical protein
VTTTGSGNPMEKPKRTPALADIAAAPTSTAKRIIFVFIMLLKAFCFSLTYTESFPVSCIAR